MSKGHMEALAALKARRHVITKVVKTDGMSLKRVLPLVGVTKLQPNNVPPKKPGRPKVYASATERQRACRVRKAENCKTSKE